MYIYVYLYWQTYTNIRTYYTILTFAVHFGAVIVLLLKHNALVLHTRTLSFLPPLMHVRHTTN